MFDLLRQLSGENTNAERKRLYDVLMYKYGISRRSARYMARNIANENVGREMNVREERK